MHSQGCSAPCPCPSAQFSNPAMGVESSQYHSDPLLDAPSHNMVPLGKLGIAACMASCSAWLLGIAIRMPICSQAAGAAPGNWVPLVSEYSKAVVELVVVVLVELRRLLVMVEVAVSEVAVSEAVVELVVVDIIMMGSSGSVSDAHPANRAARAPSTHAKETPDNMEPWKVIRAVARVQCFCW